MALLTLTGSGTAAVLIGTFLLQSGDIGTTPVSSAPMATAATPAPPTPQPMGEPQVDDARDELFELTLSTPRSVWNAGESIEIDTTLAYTGSQPEITVTGSSSGLVRFRIDQLDGDLSAGTFMNADRQPYQFRASEVQSIPFDKGGGYTPGAPDAPFWIAWINDYDLRPPAGRYRITAELDYGHPSLGADAAMPTTTLLIDVVQDAAGAGARCRRAPISIRP